MKYWQCEVNLVDTDPGEEGGGTHRGGYKLPSDCAYIHHIIHKDFWRTHTNQLKEFDLGLEIQSQV